MKNNMYYKIFHFWSWGEKLRSLTLFYYHNSVYEEKVNFMWINLLL